MISIVDTHAHLDLPAFDGDRDAVIRRAVDAGIAAVVAIGFSPERWRTTAALAARYPMVVRSVGLHPNHANEWTREMPADIEREASGQGVVAIGEIGLDFYREHVDPADQRLAFTEQVRLARRLDMPIVIHQRIAEDEVLSIVEREGPVRGVMHCFSGDERFAARCVDLGLYLGVGGVATYRSSEAIRQALSAAPLDRLILETDAPYLAPQGLRGSRNEPAMIVHAAETLAALHAVDLAAVAATTTRNAVALFGPSLATAVARGGDNALMRVIVATNNAGKIAELRSLLPSDIELITLREAGLDSPEEHGVTFAENALLKARHAAPHADAAIADDSGLEVAALDGEPGVRSARFSGPGATDEANNNELLRRLAGVGRGGRAARFVSAAAFVSRSGGEHVVEGSVCGLIGESPRGSHGFGYDPLFEIDDPEARAFSGRTMAELAIDEKNAISHRGRAVRALIADLHALGLLASEPPTKHRS